MTEFWVANDVVLSVGNMVAETCSLGRSLSIIASSIIIDSCSVLSGVLSIIAVLDVFRINA